MATSYDGASDTYRVVCQTGEIHQRFQGNVDLLLDSSGHLVGIDLGGEGFQRLVIMLGAHENVVSQRRSPAEIVRGRDGQVLYVAFSSARTAARGHEKNPYV
ncbi:hypothetical protein LVJ94_15510 [Pendulispora rubella]|uniref:Uncharacterized protein n=1 Tax=Pendulispora rubella TaxID=2741070 RepID=A0ABZ2LHL3_9BACT